MGKFDEQNSPKPQEYAPNEPDRTDRTGAAAIERLTALSIPRLQ